MGTIHGNEPTRSKNLRPISFPYGRHLIIDDLTVLAINSFHFMKTLQFIEFIYLKPWSSTVLNTILFFFFLNFQNRYFWTGFFITVQLCVKPEEMKTLNASEVCFHFAAQWDMLSETISCSSMCSFHAIVDCDHNWHSDWLSSDDLLFMMANK